VSVTPVEQPRALRVERCMGTVFTIDVRDPGRWDAAIGEAVSWFHRVDGLFSTYRDGSEISRIRRGELAVEDANPLVAEVLGLCASVEEDTGGYFSSRWDGLLDPTGLVKGWAVERASVLLRARGSLRHAVNGAGDIQLAGEPWRIGISDPLDGSLLLTVLEGGDFAVATSGMAERGAHIVDPLTASPADALASVTVVGPSLTRADAYATAAFAMGNAALGWLEGLAGYEGLVVAGDGSVATTSALR
jgi:FAD:protein FMN transferase